MKALFSGYGSIAAQVRRLSPRARWALTDQMLVSGVNFLSSVFLVRALGLQAFGLYSLVLIGLQLVATLQMSGILAPMMSVYDQRQGMVRELYLGSVFIHQIVLLAILVVLLLLLSFIPASILGTYNISSDPRLAVSLLVATQLQDFSRRVFYVTDRPAAAILSDAIAYGGKLAGFIVAAWLQYLTLRLALWVVVITSGAAILLSTADALRLRFSYSDLEWVTRKHKKIATWLLASAVPQWISASFYIVIIGTTLSASALGAVRAIQNSVGVVQIMLQSLENFVPSRTTQLLVSDGIGAVRHYMWRVSVTGAVGIVAIVAVVMIFAGPIMRLLFHRTFEYQEFILAMFAIYWALGHVTSVTVAGLRTLSRTSSIFWLNLTAAAAALVLAFPAAHYFGVVGAMAAMVITRIGFTVGIQYVFESAVKNHFLTGE